MASANGKGKMRAGSAGEPMIDFYRAIVFPNRVREQRQRHGFAKLLRLSAGIPEIPYIRLSKIERGEVVARPDELRRIAAALGIAPADLLLDIDSPDFDIAAWAEPFSDGAQIDLKEERFAVLLGAALRARRTLDPALTIAMIERDFGSLDALKTKFAAQTVAVQGSGWGWLGYDKATQKLAVATTANQGPCSTVGLVPLLGVDVWEHAYYLQYKNVRPDYVNAIWDIVNWKDVAGNLTAAK